MPNGPTVILILKVAVFAVTLLLLASLAALAAGKQRLHGRINIVFFVLTAMTVVAFEGLIRIDEARQGTLFAYIRENEELNQRLTTHLYFSIPSALLMPVMLWTGLTHRRTPHIVLAWVFGLLWLGTFVTGVFTLPHTD